MAEVIAKKKKFFSLGFCKRDLTGISVLALVIANVLPIYGVVFFGWDTFLIVLLYWAENLVIGFYNILKIVFAKANHPLEHFGKLFLIPFFAVHFGGFCAVHGIFIFLMFGRGEGDSVFPASGGEAWPCFFVFLQLLFGVIHHGWVTLGPRVKFAVGALFLSHGISFVHNYLMKGEYKNVKGDKLMSDPYSRIMVMHIAILFGGFVSMAIGSPAGILILLIALKTVVDIKLHLKQHVKFQTVK